MTSVFFLFFFGKKSKFGDGMNTGWCRNNLNHAKNQSEVKKITRKSKTVLVCYEMYLKSITMKLETFEYKLQLLSKLISIIVIIIVGIFLNRCNYVYTCFLFIATFFVHNCYILHFFYNYS